MNTTRYRVGDIADQIRGVTYRKQDASTTAIDGLLPVLRAGNITDVGLTYEDLVYVPSAKISAKQKIRKNDIVIAASSGSIDVVGKAARALADFEGGFGAFCKVLRPNRQVNPAYFAHYFKTPEYRRKISFLAAGANINNLRNADLNDLKIPLPPLAEQKRIAGILDAADVLRAKRRESLAQLDTLFQSTFLDMFGDPVTNPMGWEVTALDKVCRKITDGTHDTPQRLPDGVPFITSKNVRPFEFDLSQLDYVSQETHEEIIRRCHPVAGDVLYTNIGVNIGNAVRNTLSFEFSLKNVALLQPQPEVLDSCFLESLLNHGQFKQELIRRSSKGGAQKFIALKVLRSAHAPIPPVDLQHSFAAIIESGERQKARQRAHLAELDTLFASLQSRAFNGEL